MNGKLAITRSLGDHFFRPSGILSQRPDFIAVRRHRNNLNDSIRGDNLKAPCATLSVYFGDRRDNIFIILASDGLWDVMDNQEAVNFICEYVSDVLGFPNGHESLKFTSTYTKPQDLFHAAARELAIEAYLRGSSDNVGVCIIEL